MKKVLRPRISAWLRTLSFIAALSIVALHSDCTCCIDNPPDWLMAFRWWFCRATSFWALPFFFAVSGFFFARDSYMTGDSPLSTFYRKKTRALLIPYVIWISVATLLAFFLIGACNVHSGRFILTGWALYDSNFLHLIDNTFAILSGNDGRPKHLGALWFVRVLMIFFLMAPIWKSMRKRSLCWLLIVFFVAIQIFAPAKIGIGLFVMSIKVPSWFLLGMGISVYVPNRWTDVDDRGKAMLRLPHFLSYSFWLYCTHPILLEWIHSISNVLFGNSAAVIAAEIPISFALTVCISICVAYFVEKHFAVSLRC